MPENTGPALWADTSSQNREVMPVKVRCKTKSNGATECRLDADVLNNSEDYDKAFRQLNAFLNGRRPAATQPDMTQNVAQAFLLSPPSSSGGRSANFSRAKTLHYTGSVAVETLPWAGSGAGAGAAVAGGTSAISATASAIAPPLIAAAVFGPSQATWNKQNQLIQFADETETEITVNVVVREGEVSGESQPPAPVGGGSGSEPPNGYRTWREIFRDLRDKISKIRGWKFREWYKAKQGKVVAKVQEEMEKAPEAGKVKWFFKRLGKGLKEFGIDRGRYLKKSAVDLKDVAADFTKHPIRENLGLLNRPGKLVFYTSNAYAFLSIASALWRRITGSSKINPLGSDIFSEKYEGVIEPSLGIFCAASIAAAVDHYFFGWRRASAIIYETIIAFYPYAVQSASGGSDRKSTDWNRAYLNTFASSIIWGPIAAYRKVVNVAFPNLRWAIYLTKLEEEGHKAVPKLLNAIPVWLAPSIVPSKGNFLTYYSILTAHGYTVLSIDIISDDADFGERYACYTAELSAFVFTRWFDMAFDPYSRPLIGAATGIFKIFVYREYSKYFQFYKGKKFYRNVLHGMAKDNVPYKDAISQLDAIFATESLFGEYNELVPEDLYDFYLDVAEGKFTAREKEYFYGLATHYSTHAPQYKRLKLALRYIFEKSYKNREDFYSEIEKINSGD